VHLRKVQIIHTRKREARKKSMKNTEFAAIALEFQKNLPIPNISTNDVYHKVIINDCTRGPRKVLPISVTYG
jgi:hypothetical protein